MAVGLKPDYNINLHCIKCHCIQYINYIIYHIAHGINYIIYLLNSVWIILYVIFHNGIKYIIFDILFIVNWVVRALNGDWLTAVVYQTGIPRV